MGLRRVRRQRLLRGRSPGAEERQRARGVRIQHLRPLAIDAWAWASCQCVANGSSRCCASADVRRKYAQLASHQCNSPAEARLYGSGSVAGRSAALLRAAAAETRDGQFADAGYTILHLEKQYLHILRICACFGGARGAMGASAGARLRGNSSPMSHPLSPPPTQKYRCRPAGPPAQDPRRRHMAPGPRHPPLGPGPGPGPWPLAAWLIGPVVAHWGLGGPIAPPRIQFPMCSLSVGSSSSQHSGGRGPIRSRSRGRGPGARAGGPKPGPGGRGQGRLGGRVSGLGVRALGRGRQGGAGGLHRGLQDWSPAHSGDAPPDWHRPPWPRAPAPGRALTSD